MLAISGLLRNPSVSYELFLDTRPDSLAGMAEVQDWMQKLLTQYDRAMTLLDEMNAASDNAKWAKVQELVTITYRDLLQVDLTAYAGVEDVRALFQRMTGRYYSDLDAIRETYVQACADQLEYEKNNPTQTTTPTSSNRGSSSIRGSSGGGISSVIGNWVSSSASAQTEPADNAQSSVTPEGMVLPEMAFHDLEEVPWAAEAINALRERGIVHGDGTGAFEPMRGVTREEMLSMLLSAFSLPEADPSTETFTDVPANAWFYENVILARSLGMVQGLPDGNFGAGQPVTRADMAVMSGRLLDILGCTPTPTRAAIVFRDYSEIPDYAKEMVSLLQQAGVLNGDTEGNYLPTGSATRAEAAVMLYNLIQIVEG